MAQPVIKPRLYTSGKRAKDLMFVSGQLPVGNDGMLYFGRVAVDVAIGQPRESAALAARHCPDVIRNELDSLDAVESVARIAGHVAAGEYPVDIPGVIDAASETILDVSGARGQYARLALGVAALPLSACVEVEMTVQW